jgi:hypothetical protein
VLPQLDLEVEWDPPECACVRKYAFTQGCGVRKASTVNPQPGMTLWEGTPRLIEATICLQELRDPCAPELSLAGTQLSGPCGSHHAA